MNCTIDASVFVAVAKPDVEHCVSGTVFVQALSTLPFRPSAVRLA